MSAVDVLAVMETVAFRTYESQPLMPSKEQERICVHLASELREARAAVAELIEAATDLAEAAESVAYQKDARSILNFVEYVNDALARCKGETK